MAKGQRALLPPEDEKQLRDIAASGSDLLRQRAQAILAWHDGETVNDTARKTRLSVNQVQSLWRAYRTKGLDLFLADAEAAPARTGKRAEEPKAVPPTEPGVTLEALCKTNRVNMEHARRVAALSLQVFDATSTIHRLPQSLRPLMEAAAIVHNVGLAADPDNHHTRGRDILLAEPIRGFTDDERRILATTTAFHRKRVRPEAEPAYQALPSDLQSDALKLSAILRIADGLDYSGDGLTDIAQIQAEPEELVIAVSGPHPGPDIQQAQKKSDLWTKVFGARVRILEAVPEAPAEAEGAPSPLRFIAPRSPAVQSTMSVARAAQTFALHTLDRLTSLLRMAQGGDVSLTRSLARDAERLVEAVSLIDPKLKAKDLKWLAETLNTTYVASALAERALAVAEETGESALNARVLAWEAEARDLMKSFDAERFARLAADLRRELAADVSGPDAAIAYHAGAILWGQLATLRGVMEHGESVEDALHAAQRLQDTLIAFRSLLGPEVAQVLDILSPLESYLAAIQTTQAVLQRLETAAKPARKGRKATAAADEAMASMRKAQQDALEHLADELPGVWSGVNSVIFRRAFALAIAAP
jgi:hypothetical protein